MEAAGQHRRGVGHRGHRGAAVAGLGEGGEVGPGAGGHLLARDVRLDTGRLERAGVGEQDVDPGLAEPVAEEGVLVALGVERAYEQDGRAHARARTDQSADSDSPKSASSRRAFSAPPGL